MQAERADLVEDRLQSFGEPSFAVLELDPLPIDLRGEGRDLIGGKLSHARRDLLIELRRLGAVLEAVARVRVELEQRNQRLPVDALPEIVVQIRIVAQVAEHGPWTVSRY